MLLSSVSWSGRRKLSFRSTQLGKTSVFVTAVWRRPATQVDTRLATPMYLSWCPPTSGRAVMLISGWSWKAYQSRSVGGGGTQTRRVPRSLETFTWRRSGTFEMYSPILSTNFRARAAAASRTLEKAPPRRRLRSAVPFASSSGARGALSAEFRTPGGPEPSACAGSSASSPSLSAARRDPSTKFMALSIRDQPEASRGSRKVSSVRLKSPW
mmetsp:Transcript_25958/g.61713  ORF Transcript_25958/g.61713 Transcript_25958/m.61713 type:complete len:212 (-) Transcript_25958:349-984(-)